jgi:hypothetical protein
MNRIYFKEYFMANELQQLPNPTNVPEAVKTGYQRQNTNMFAIQTGLDTTEPTDNGDLTITIPGGGLVEVNGVLFKVTNTVTLTKPTNIACWVAVKDNGDGAASFSLVEKPGFWDPAKKGCYRSDGSRTLNFVSMGAVHYAGLQQVFSTNVKGRSSKYLERGWYLSDLQSGLGNSPGQNGVSATSSSVGTGGNGGVAVYSSFQRIIFFSEGKEIVIIVGGSGGNGGKGANGTFAGGDISNGGGGAGGGGSGSGEATEIVGIDKTGRTKPGQGGDGGYGNGSGFRGAGGDGAPVGNGDTANGANAGTQGLNGEYQPNGTPGGFCNIYRMEGD